MAIHVVHGPPCGGKSTYVDTHRAPNDLVVDLDALGAALGTWNRDPADELRVIAQVARRAVIAHIGEFGYATGDIWIIDTQPRPEMRAFYFRTSAEFVLCDPGFDVALQRSISDHRPAWTPRAIRNWYTNRSKEIR